ncbi:HNH endonuclease [Saccharicrinis sp. FJH54]|uniref:HNH endonuclease n=1 Tax=Saccharicrinis sp. FJH54 TaxID=3344665 RepID=UPI0035D49951
MKKKQEPAFAFFENGIYENVLNEILSAQSKKPGRTFYIQPYSGYIAQKLKKRKPSLEKPIPMYISTTSDLNHVVYTAEIIYWDHKHQLDPEREKVIVKDLNTFQPGENGLYKFDENSGHPCVNLISIRNLKKLELLIPVSKLIKISDDTPYKERTRSGGWSYVKPLDPGLLHNVVYEEDLEREFQRNVKRSLSDDPDKRRERLKIAKVTPQKRTVASSGFIRNPDVVAEVLYRAKGVCERCKQAAPFIKASDGSPYLEVHHWLPLAEGGEDTVKNAAALCPNCHKEAHFGKNKTQIMKEHTQLK